MMSSQDSLPNYTCRDPFSKQVCIHRFWELEHGPRFGEEATIQPLQCPPKAVLWQLPPPQEGLAVRVMWCGVEEEQEEHGLGAPGSPQLCCAPAVTWAESLSLREPEPGLVILRVGRQQGPTLLSRSRRPDPQEQGAGNHFVESEAVVKHYRDPPRKQRRADANPSQPAGHQIIQPL